MTNSTHNIKIVQINATKSKLEDFKHNIILLVTEASCSPS